MSAKTKNILLSLILIGLTALVFLPSLFNQITHWDDQFMLTDNKLVAKLTPAGIKEIFSSFTNGSYVPLTILSYAVEFKFFRFNPLAYHTTNLILHILNVLLVFWLLRLITKETLVAFITALLFAVNPLKVESVAWISARKDLLFSLFFLSSAITYLYYIRQDRRNPLGHLASFVLFLLSILAKPQAMILPIVLVALDYFHDPKTWKTHLISKFSFIGVAVISLIVGHSSLTPYLADQTFYGHFGPLDKLLLTVYSVFFYIGQTLVPIHICCLYPYPLKVSGVFPWGVYLSPFLLGFIIFLIYRKFKEDNIFILALSLFAITLALPLTNIWLGGYFASDRYMYLPSIGLFLALVHCAIRYGKTKLGAFRQWNIILLVIYILFLSVLSLSKCFVWRNDVTLWSDVLDLFPNTPIAYNNRGSFYMEAGEIRLALDDFNECLRINPKHKDAYFNRAILYTDTGKYDLAIADYSAIIALDSRQVESYNNRGYIFFQQQKYQDALNDFNQALAINPSYIQTRFNRAQIYIQQQDYRNAQADLGYVLKLDPAHNGAKEALQTIDQHLKP